MEENMSTVDLKELMPILLETQSPSMFALELITEQIEKKHTKLNAMLGGLINATVKLDGTGLPAMRPAEYQYVIGSLSRLQIDAAKEQRPNELIEDEFATLQDHTEGIRRERWKRIRKILNYRLSKETDGERGMVATVDKEKRTRKKTLLKRLSLMNDFLAHAHPSGFDVFAPHAEDGKVRTIDAREPTVISMGDGGAKNRIELLERPNRETTRLTFVGDAKGFHDVHLLDIDMFDGLLIGNDRDVEECFGAKLDNTIELPVGGCFGNNPSASTLLFIRWREQLAILVKRPRAAITIEQANKIWHYEPPERDIGDEDDTVLEGED